MRPTPPTYSLLIKGNQEDPAGNALAKIRKTARQYWTPEARRYEGWKQHVRVEFARTTSIVKYDLEGKKLAHPIQLVENGHARMEVMIGWGKENHADGEGVFGSIADALFENDKHLRGAFDYVHTEDRKGWVSIKIWIYGPDPERGVVPAKKKRSKSNKDRAG